MIEISIKDIILKFPKVRHLQVYEHWTIRVLYFLSRNFIDSTDLVTTIDINLFAVTSLHIILAYSGIRGESREIKISASFEK